MNQIFDKLKTKLDDLRQKRRTFLKSTRSASWEFQVATWFGAGLLIPAPGTWGTLGGLLFGLLLLAATSPLVTFIIACLLTGLGYLATKKIESRMSEHDSSFIVIDEVAAILFVLALLPVFTPFFVGAGFLIFRFFDALKPWPINWLDKEIGGAAGVMVDDLMAALYTLLILWGLYGFI